MSRAVFLFAAALLLLAACDLPDNQDEEYIRGFCRASAEYSDALIRTSTVSDLEQAAADYAAALEKLSPPSDAAAWHRRYVDYVRAAAANREDEPPRPPGDVRRRLESAAGSQDECDGNRFFRD